MKNARFDSLLELGLSEYAAGSLDNAIRHYEHARRIAQQLGNRSIEAVALHRIGATESERGNLERAARLLSVAAETFKLEGSEDALAAVLIDQGIVAKDAGDYDLAKEFYSKALELGQKRALASITLAAKANLAQLARRRGDSATAIALLQDIVPEFERMENWASLIPMLSTLAVIATETQHHDVAVNAWKRLQLLGRKTNRLDLLATAAANLGHVYNALNQFKESRQAYEDALGCFRRLGNVEGMSNCYLGLASAAQIIGSEAEMKRYLYLAQNPPADPAE
jgi:tetratricopeptide (TPR) repeat protein